VAQAACKFALVGLASHAGPDGAGAFPSVATLVRYTGLSERTVPTCLDRLGPGHYRAVRRRRYPVAGDGGGITSFIHLDAAAAVIVLALEHDRSAIYNITDDEPAPMREWLPTLAAALGARPPLPALGRAGVFLGATSRQPITRRSV
jgi:nucleoside-diphosphate-sugar epimerase